MGEVETGLGVGYRAHAVRKATSDDVPVLARVLTRAFDRDPVVDRIVRRDRRRSTAIARMLGRDLLVRVALPAGEVYTTTERAGVAMWLPPGKTSLPWPQRARMLPSLAANTGSRRLLQAIRLRRRLGAFHPSQPHFGLAAVAVDPDKWGRGIGTALLRPVLDRCDAQGLPAYLEATSNSNRGLFELLGFETVDAIAVGYEQLTIWPMVRQPCP